MAQLRRVFFVAVFHGVVTDVAVVVGA